jgi:hypothetical protein
MHPDAAKILLASVAGGPVLDPFCGGGTVLVEALLAGRSAIGRDINPVAEVVAKARTHLMDEVARRTFEEEALGIAERASREPARVPEAVYRLRDWYAPTTLRELSALLRIVERASARELLIAVHSSLVVKLSHRASDTSARRLEVRHPPGTALRAFVARARELSRMLAELRQAVPPGVAAQVALGDARALETPTAAIVCTSPPYPATYDYLPLQQLRLAWLAPEHRELRDAAEIGARRRFRRSVEAGYASWITDTQRWIRSARARLTPEGRLVVLIGDGIARGTLLDARRPTERAAAAVGLKLEAAASIERVDPATRLAKREHALVFRNTP